MALVWLQWCAKTLICLSKKGMTGRAGFLGGGGGGGLNLQKATLHEALELGRHQRGALAGGGLF